MRGTRVVYLHSLCNSEFMCTNEVGCQFFFFFFFFEYILIYLGIHSRMAKF